MADMMSLSPVFVREFRAQMRRPWLYLAIGLYLCLLIPAGVFFLYRYAAVSDSGLGLELSRRVQQGAVLFALVLFALQLLLLTVLTPAFTSGAFATERVRGTLTPVLITPLSSRRIVTGKWQAMVACLVVLLLSTVPLCAISSLFGGISPLDLLAGYGVLVAYAFLLVAIGLYISARSPHAGRAIAWTYAMVFAAPLCFPFLLIPYAAMASWLATGESLLLATLVRDLPLPLLALPALVLTWLFAQWCITETSAILDAERHLWGTYPPPLPGDLPVMTPPTTAPVPSARPTRRW